MRCDYRRGTCEMTAGDGTVKLAALRTEARPKLRAVLFAVLEGSLLRRSSQANTAFTDTDQFVRHLRRDSAKSGTAAT